MLARQGITAYTRLTSTGFPIPPSPVPMSLSRMLGGALLALLPISLDAQEQVVNGDFSDGANSWNLYDGASVSFGVLGLVPFLTSATQRVGTVAGQQYTFSFFFSFFAPVPLVGSSVSAFEARLGGVNQLLIPGSATMSRQQYSTTYTATGEQTEVRFTAGLTGSWFWTVDNVSLTGPSPTPPPVTPPTPTTTVPEPSSIALVAAGLASLAGLAQLRRRRLS